MDELVRFHRDLWERGEVSAILTSVHYVHRRLRAAGAPVCRIYPARSPIRTEIEAKLAGLRARDTKDRQIAVLVIAFGTGSTRGPGGPAAYAIHASGFRLIANWVRWASSWRG